MPSVRDGNVICIFKRVCMDRDYFWDCAKTLVYMELFSILKHCFNISVNVASVGSAGEERTHLVSDRKHDEGERGL